MPCTPYCRTVRRGTMLVCLDCGATYPATGEDGSAVRLPLETELARLHIPEHHVPLDMILHRLKTLCHPCRRFTDGRCRIYGTCGGCLQRWVHALLGGSPCEFWDSDPVSRSRSHSRSRSRNAEP